MAAPSASAFQAQKLAYLDQEEQLETLLSSREFLLQFQAWMDETLAALDTHYDACEQQLGELQHKVAVDEGDYWDTKTLIQHCNLCMNEKRLVSTDIPIETHPSWPDLIQLISVLNSLKTKGFISPQQTRFLERIESELKGVVLLPHEIKCIAASLRSKLTSEAEKQSIITELTKYQNTIEERAPDLAELEEELEAALTRGDMSLAEDISYRQLEVYEHLLDLITQQYPILNQRHAEYQALRRRRRWMICQIAMRDISRVIEGKQRQIDACQEDFRRIEEQTENYAVDDKSQRKRYQVDRQESEHFLISNKEKQQAVWNRIHGMLQDLAKCQDELTDLARQRRKEIDRRLQLEEREAARRSGHRSFMRVANQHMQLLGSTVDNAKTGMQIAKALNDFVLDSCDSVTAKFDRREKMLNELLFLVQNNHFKRFTEFYLAAGRLRYRKEKKGAVLNSAIDDTHIKYEMACETYDPVAKKHSDDKKALLLEKTRIADDVVWIQRRIDAAERKIDPLLESYRERGVPYVHPKEILAKADLCRAEKILDWREQLQAQSDFDRIIRDEEKMLDMQRQTTKTIKASKEESKARQPRPPLGASPVARQQYARFQQLLERKLELPSGEKLTPISSSPISPGPVPVSSSFGAAADQEQALSKTADRDQKRHSHLSPGSTLKALFRYVAQMNDELSFEKGDTIVCIAPAPEEGWFSGVCNQKTGLFPGNYVRMVEE